MTDTSTSTPASAKEPEFVTLPNGTTIRLDQIRSVSTIRRQIFHDGQIFPDCVLVNMINGPNLRCEASSAVHADRIASAIKDLISAQYDVHVIR
jgi:hypothetical protein